MVQRIMTLTALRGVVVVWVVSCLTGSFAVAQDGVKLSGLWVQPVKVLGIEHGQVRYQIASGQVLTRPVTNLQGLNLSRYPGLADAQRAIEQGDDAQAVESLRAVLDRAREDWVRGYAGMRLVAVHTRLDDADKAADIYIDLVVSNADLGFIAEPPVDVVAGADVAVRQRVSELADKAKRTVSPDRAALLDKLIEATGKPKVLPATGLDTSVKAAPRTQAPPVPPGAKVQGLTLSTSVPPGTAANLFRRGNYEQSLRVTDESLTRPGKTASELYLKGMSQLALAEHSGGESDYKSAGLSFMRVLVYFPRSAVAGPATVELGYVHERIGRSDIAAKLYDRAGPLINQREDPVYFQRLIQRVESAAEASSGD